jgi:hypothetical protein
MIDTTLISAGAFSYRVPAQITGGLPLLYWLSGFPGGVLLTHFYPDKEKLQFPYILLASAIFLGLELIMHFFGYIHYHKWSPVNSYFLDVFGFIIVIWIWNWIRERKGVTLHTSK